MDDSRTMQALLESAFATRSEFEVIGVASDARDGADLIHLLKPHIATIDLCMPYIDGVELLEMINQERGTCAIMVSDHSVNNATMTAKLQELGAAACLGKTELARDPKTFFDKINAAYDAFQAARLRSILTAGTSDKAARQPSTRSAPSQPLPHAGFPVPVDEARRVHFLSTTGLASAVRERQFDLVTRHFASVAQFPVCLITFIDKDTQWIKSGQGLQAGSTPREQAFCNYTISQDGPFVVNDATTDNRFSANPLVTGPPFVRSYAGHPITAADGTNIGALCLIDMKPRMILAETLRQLAGMAEIVSEMIAHRSPRSA